MEVNRLDLIKAFHNWNKEAIENKADFDAIDDSVDCAERQADKLIECLNDLTS